MEKDQLPPSTILMGEAAKYCGERNVLRVSDVVEMAKYIAILDKTDD